MEFPIIQAPMIGPKSELTAAVSMAGGLGSLACASLSADQIREEVGKIRAQTTKPFNLNFFCHTMPARDVAREAAWMQKLAPYYAELKVDPAQTATATARAPFNEAACRVIEEVKPRVVSFHFGLPEPGLLHRVKSAGCVVIASATTVAEARALEAAGVDAVIAQGTEAGGHRGMFLTAETATQVGAFALIPQIADAVSVPVIAAGGVADARGIVAAFALGASAVQMGTAYLLCPEAKTAPLHRAALKTAHDDSTALTNVFTGRPARSIVNRAARELGFVSKDVPAFPLAAASLQPIRAKAEVAGSSDFSPLWAGQAAALAQEISAADLTRQLAEQALSHFAR